MKTYKATMISELSRWKEMSSRGGRKFSWLFRRPSLFKKKGGLDEQLRRLEDAIKRESRKTGQLIENILAILNSSEIAQLNKKRKEAAAHIREKLQAFRAEAIANKEAKKTRLSPYLDERDLLTKDSRNALDQLKQSIDIELSSSSTCIAYMLDETTNEIRRRLSGKGNPLIRDASEVRQIYTRAAVSLLDKKKLPKIPSYYHMTQYASLDAIVEKDGKIKPSQPNLKGSANHSGGVWVSKEIETTYGNHGIALDQHALTNSQTSSVDWSMAKRLASKKESWRAIEGEVPVRRDTVCRLITGSMSRTLFGPKGIPVISKEAAELEHRLLRTYQCRQ